MRHRGFLINSAVLLLLIPLLLVLATYEDISSYIISSQSSRVRTETMHATINSIELDMERASEISMKRAVITILQSAIIGEEVKNVNETIANLIVRGWSYSPPYNISMPYNETLKFWYENTKKVLKEMGFRMSFPNGDFEDNINVTVAQLDAFHIVAEIRIKNVTISDLSGRIVYQGPLPRGGPMYPVMSIEGLEDPLFPVSSGGHLHRIIVAAPYDTYLREPLVGNLSGSGISILGTLSNLSVKRSKGFVRFYDSSPGEIGVAEKFSQIANYVGEGFVFKELGYSLTELLNISEIIGKPIVYNTTISPVGWAKERDIAVVVVNGTVSSIGVANILSGNGTFYDLQYLSNSIEEGYYFGVYINDSVSCNPPSFFDRLEGNLCLTSQYFEKAKEFQLKLGLTNGSYYYPIGLVSFVNPADVWKNYPVLRRYIEEKVSKNQSCADYQFFASSDISGDLIYGLDLASWYDEKMPFRLNQHLFGVILGEGYRYLINS